MGGRKERRIRKRGNEGREIERADMEETEERRERG